MRNNRPNLMTATEDAITDWVQDSATARSAKTRNAMANAAWTRRYDAGEFDLEAFHAGVAAFTATAAYRRNWLRNSKGAA